MVSKGCRPQAGIPYGKVAFSYMDGVSFFLPGHRSPHNRSNNNQTTGSRHRSSKHQNSEIAYCVATGESVEKKQERKPAGQGMTLVF